MSSLWNVHGRTESGDDWDLEFIGPEAPSHERINYVYAQVMPEEWAYSPEASILSINEVSSYGAHSCEGPTLECGEDFKEVPE